VVLAEKTKNYQIASSIQMQVFLLKEYAPRMGVAMDIFAVNSSASEKNYELAGQVYEDGSERVSIGRKTFSL
jgi:hypothetical protein